jgi:hypothetical protein
MANPHTGSHDVTINGESYRFRFSTNAIVEAEAETGLRFFDIGARLEDDSQRSFADLRWMFWVGLRAERPTLTLDDAGDLIDALGLVTATGVAFQALEASLANPTPARKTRKTAKKSRRSGGISSSTR